MTLIVFSPFQFVHFIASAVLFSFLYGYPAIFPAMRLWIANHCPFLLSLAISFFFTLPSKKSSVFLRNYIFPAFLTKSCQIVVYLHNDFRVGV